MKGMYLHAVELEAGNSWSVEYEGVDRVGICLTCTEQRSLLVDKAVEQTLLMKLCPYFC